MKQVLLLCFDNPFLPPKEGGKLGMLSRIASLSLLPISLDIVLLNKPTEGFVEELSACVKEVHEIRQFRMNNASPLDLLSPYPICVNKRYTRDVTAFLRDKTYDAVIYEGAHMMKYRIKNAVSAKRHILYMHDIESAYRRETASAIKNPLKRLLQNLESQKFRWLEKKIDTLFDAVMFVSCEERDTLAKDSSHPDDYVYTPIPSVKTAEAAELGARGHTALYVGDLSITHNYLSVKWFCEEVFPLVAKRVPDAELRIVGRISDENKEELSALYSGIRVLGYVDDLAAEYHNASFFACPMLYGAGVKVKTIDALAQGQIVVGSPKAIEGTRLQSGTHIAIADTADEMADICVSILEHREDYTHLAENALAFMKTEHSTENQKTIIEALI